MDISRVSIEEFSEKDIDGVIAAWNEVVDEGVAFPQTEPLTVKSGLAFFREQTYTGIAKEKETGRILGLYILHPNNIGRCGHIANASYAVSGEARGLHIGELLVLDSLEKAKEHGFTVMQFNAVVSTNERALRLYKKLGFTQLGVIPKGFRLKDGTYLDIIPHYREIL